MPLTDNEMRIVELLVQNEIRKGWRRRIAMALAIFSAAMGACTYYLGYVAQETERGVEEFVQEATDELLDRPYVNGLDSDWSVADRLVIDGSAFGSIPGRVELYYKVFGLGGDGTGETRTPTLSLSDESIELWTENMIIVTTTEEQRRVLLDRVDEPDFADLTPYIRVVRADLTRSPVW